MTEPLAKSEQVEMIEKQIQAVNNKHETIEEMVHSRIGTIVYKLDISGETSVETRQLKRRDFNWDSGKVDGRKKELKQSQFENTSLSTKCRLSLASIKEIGQSLLMPFSLYSTLLYFWVKVISHGMNRQDLKMRHQYKFSMRSSLYMAVTFYGMSYGTMTALSVTSYSTMVL